MTVASRFWSGYPWRFVVTTLTGEVVTSLERLASNRTLTFKLNAPAVATGQVPSDDPRVNIPDVEVGLDAPHVSFADRLLFGFRREAINPADWVCRFGGILTQIEDSAQTDQPYSTFTAYDPWQYLFHRRLLDGTDPVGVDGLHYTMAGNLIVDDILTHSLAADGEMHIDWVIGDWDTTAVVDITFQQSTTVGEALSHLCQNHGMDIEFRPYYNAAQPGVCCLVYVHSEMGSVQDGAVFSWDQGRAVQSISRLLDGDQLANDVRYHYGQGGPAAAPAQDATSATRYGVYTSEQFFPGRTNEVDIDALAAFQLSLRKDGRRSVAITPSPLLAPKPFLDYGLGDRVPVYATTRLRQAIPA